MSMAQGFGWASMTDHPKEGAGPSLPQHQSAHQARRNLLELRFTKPHLIPGQRNEVLSGGVVRDGGLEVGVLLPQTARGCHGDDEGVEARVAEGVDRLGPAPPLSALVGGVEVQDDGPLPRPQHAPDLLQAPLPVLDIPKAVPDGHAVEARVVEGEVEGVAVDPADRRGAAFPAPPVESESEEVLRDRPLQRVAQHIRTEVERADVAGTPHFPRQQKREVPAPAANIKRSVPHTALREFHHPPLPRPVEAEA
mmetsp:Transcript_3877/g.13612  ORF Transcript_3877/g.13612 Transcript_3877/m.13612 type:complete len:252 (-) Transcript_3877:337-1092(-)